MFLDDLRVTTPGLVSWLAFWRPGHFIWLTKESEFAQVEWAFEQDIPGARVGRIGIRHVIRHNHSWALGQSQSWYTTAGGHGIDGSLIIEPVWSPVDTAWNNDSIRFRTGVWVPSQQAPADDGLLKPIRKLLIRKEKRE